MKLVRCAVCLFCLVVSAHVTAAQSAAPQSGKPQGTSNVEGRVLHEPGGEPIRKAILRLWPSSDDPRAYASSATDSGINEAEVAAVFTGGFGVSEGSDERLQYTAVSDAQGRFKFEKVPPGTYMVVVSRDGYVPAETKPRAMQITVVDGQSLTDLTYKMSTAGLITGKIVDADGDPVSGLMVQAIPRSEKKQSSAIGLVTTFLSLAGIAAPNLPGMVSTNDLGEYRIAGLPAGQYLVVARPGGNLAPPPTPANKERADEHLLYAATYYPGVLDEKQASALQLASGTTATADFTLLVHRTYRVSGIVSGLAGAKGSFIMLISNNGRPQQQPLGEGGKFEFPSLEPGTYFAQIMEVSEAAEKEGPKMLTVPTPIVVSGSDLTDMVLQPFANGKVSGRFRTEGEDSVDWKQMSVTLLHVAEPGENPADKGLFALFRQGGTGILNEDGTFKIDDVAPGNYQLVVFAPSDKYRDWYLKSLLFAGREAADSGFAASGDTSLDVVISARGASIEGKVMDSAGKPAAGVFVVTLPSSGKLARPDSYQTAKTDARGNFLLRGMNPGDFAVVALDNFQGDARNPDFCQKYASLGTNVTLAEGEKKIVTLTLLADDSKR